MELKDIKAIIDLMKKNDLAVFKLEKEGFKIELEAHRSPAPLVSALPGPQVVTAAPKRGSSAQVPSTAPAAAPEEEPSFKEIVSPMVGTFTGRLRRIQRRMSRKDRTSPRRRLFASSRP